MRLTLSPMSIAELNAVEQRIVGALMEKESTTPEYYPLSLNALVNACNQKNNREPVMELDEQTVREALHQLEAKGYAGLARSDSRVPKFEHRIGDLLNLGRREFAILCVLLLRGAQTPGELKSRTERIFRFDELSDVVSTLQRMAEREPRLVQMLPRTPGTKESRYTHTLGPAIESAPTAQTEAASDSQEDRLTALEREIRELRTIVDDLRGKIL